MPQAKIIAPVKPKAAKGSAFTPATQLSEDQLARQGFIVGPFAVVGMSGYGAGHKTPRNWEDYSEADGTPKRFRHKKQALTFIRREERKSRRIATR